MNKQIALAYGIAGLAVAIATIAVIATSTGLFTDQSPTAPALTSSPVVDAVAPPEPALPAVAPTESVQPEPVEYVYVDAPRRGHDDERWEREDDDDDEHEHGRDSERRESRERDDD